MVYIAADLPNEHVMLLATGHRGLLAHLLYC